MGLFSGRRLVDCLVKLIVLVALGIMVYGGSLLVWPIFRLFNRTQSPRAKRLRRVFFVTLFFWFPLAATYAVVLIRGQFDHNWLKGTTWFYLINLISLLCSIVAAVMPSDKPPQ